MRKRTLLIPGLAIVAAAIGAIAWAERGLPPAEEAARLSRELALDPDSIVADVGAGAGRITIALSRLFDGRLRLYATELAGDKVSQLRDALEKAGLHDVTLLGGGERHPNLPGACCDAVLLRRVYHHLGYRSDFAAGLHEALRGDGRVAIIDFAPSLWRFWMPRHGVAPETVEREMAAAGFAKVNEIRNWGFNDYCLVFQRLPRTQSPAMGTSP
jgi:SAM-dependent methyltransferase